MITLYLYTFSARSTLCILIKYTLTKNGYKNFVPAPPPAKTSESGITSIPAIDNKYIPILSPKKWCTTTTRSIHTNIAHRNQKFVKNMPNQPLIQAAKSIFPRIILNPAFNSIHNVIQEAIGIIRLSAFLLIISKEAYFSIVLPNSHPLMQANNGI